MVLKFRQDENLNLVPTCKELGNCHFTHTRKKEKKKLLNIVKINNFSWAYQRNEVAGHISIWKFKEEGEHRESQMSSAM